MYSIKQVSTMLDMPSVTIRAWENRYGAVKPLRTESGYRMYSPDDIEDLKWLKEQVEEKGMSISQAVLMLKAGKSFPGPGRGEPFPTLGAEQQEGPYEELSGQIFNALFTFQSERANRLIDYGFSIYGYDAMFYKVLVPVLVKVGDAWEAGTASVAQEHFMTELISRRFFQFFHLFPVHSYMPKVLSLCPEGEYHQVGLMLFSLLLRRNGLDVAYLGPNTPREGLLDIIDSQGIGIVCLSVTNARYVGRADELVDYISEAFPEVLFLLGGKGYGSGTKSRYTQWVMNEPAEQWQEWLSRFLAQHQLRP
ncbi:transcriptional regulator, MerR family protein [Paenibacillus algicola]|uniref:Transcriptional regulator, MerR family protein n=1 Tax=Paenibacillus algicola TaxID=2565926 RepID=A0A4P8XUW0_9BACL|nr:MerR family transcriptional regulator [Paenibacillus algicola]QCT04629.1 transcriptional regulator, MerR family protein [Paenibacillus algicola]